jgi:hypothetical protein
MARGHTDEPEAPTEGDTTSTTDSPLTDEQAAGGLTNVALADKVAGGSASQAELVEAGRRLSSML